MMDQRIPEELIMNTTLLKDLAAVAKDAALLQGVLMRTPGTLNSSEVVTYKPFTLFPVLWPTAVFHQALSLQTHFNSLVDKISQDADFLQGALASTIATDDFISRLFGIHQQILREGRSQSIVLGLNRSDYLLDQREDKTLSLKQVEINTIAAAGAGIVSSMPKLHRQILKLTGRQDDSRCIPDNNAAAGLAKAIAKAWELYGSERSVVMFLVEDVQWNIFDQRLIEHQLWMRNILTTRKRFDDICKTGSLDRDKRLFVDGLEVAVVYFRHGYNPEHYVSEQHWDALLMMERSLAVKCPDISTHLTGTKKVQQVLAKPGVLERFFPDQPEVVEQIRATFAGLYTLDEGPEGDETAAMAVAAPDRFVLKPQREGGGAVGNNIFGSDMVTVLEGLKETAGRAAYILMDKIQPVILKNCLLSPNAPIQISDCVSELGVYGAYVRHNKDLVLNECVGHMVRSKKAKLSGGVTAGASAIGCSLLV